MSAARAACAGQVSAECQLAQGYAYLGVTRGFPLAVDYVAGLDLTGHGLRFEVLDPVTVAPLLTKSTEASSVTITSAAEGRASWTVTAAETLALPLGQLSFRVSLTNGTGVLQGAAPLTWGQMLVRS